MNSVFPQHPTTALPLTGRSAWLGMAFLSALAASLVPAAESGFDWPQFRGPRRDGVSRETGLLKSWPADGPALIWERTGISGGRLFSAPTA